LKELLHKISCELDIDLRWYPLDFNLCSMLRIYTSNASECRCSSVVTTISYVMKKDWTAQHIRLLVPL